MRKQILVSLISVLALCGCDNPEEYSHPENPKKPGQIEVTPSTTPAAGTAPATDPGAVTTPPATTTATPPPPVSTTERDTSATKIGEASITQPFDSLMVDASLEVDVTTGAPNKVTIEASEKSFSDIKLEVKDNTLNITTRQNFNATVAKIHITCPSMNNIVARGSALIKVNGITGSAVNITAGGSSTVEVTGTTDTINVTAGEACCVKGKNLKAQRGNVTTADKCAVEVYTREEVNANSRGGSVINIFGQPRKVNKVKKDQSFITLSAEKG